MSRKGTNANTLCAKLHPKRSDDFQQRPRRICLFGTSANPPTGREGHVGLVEALVNLGRYDEIRVLPVYRHTFSSKRDTLVPFSHRVAMCELAFSTILPPPACAGDKTKGKRASDPIICVSRAEEQSFRRMCRNDMTEEEIALLRVGTADLLEMFLEEESESEFSFCLGADTFMDLTDWKWKRSRDVLKLIGGRLVVVSRKFEMRNTPSKSLLTKESLEERVRMINSTPLGNGKIILLDVPTLGDVSSSKVRNSIDQKSARKILSPSVFDYIVAHNLYGFGE